MENWFRIEVILNAYTSMSALNCLSNQLFLDLYWLWNTFILNVSYRMWFVTCVLFSMFWPECFSACVCFVLDIRLERTSITETDTHMALSSTRQNFSLIFSFFQAQSDGSQFSWEWNIFKIPKVWFYSYNVYLGKFKFQLLGII